VETTISPAIQTDPTLRPLVEQAEVELRQSLRTPAEGRTWAWTVSDGPEPRATLTLAYEGNTSSHTFSMAELRTPGLVGLEGRTLWGDVLVANIRRTRDRVLKLLQEVRDEEGALQGA
jgi:hypothetical protein